jgi:hypothetical protein
MAKRRNQKKEKALRNQAYARKFRKRTPMGRLTILKILTLMELRIRGQPILALPILALVAISSNGDF